MRLATRIGLAVLALSCSYINASAVNFAPDPDWNVRSWVHPDGTVHYYRRVGVTFTNGEWLTWDQAEAWAEASTFAGRPGYLATITSAAEMNWMNDQFWITGAGTLLGALGDPTNGEWRWVVGPEAGLPVNFLAVPGQTCAGGGARTRLVISSGAYWSKTPNAGLFVDYFWWWGGACQDASGPHMTVEYGGALPTHALNSSWGNLKSKYR